jgi:putative transposase
MDALSLPSHPARKRVRHFDLPGDAHFLTFSCFHRLPLQSKDRTRTWLVEAIVKARAKWTFDLWAWVIMPEHVHLLIHPRGVDTRISGILADIKRPVGQRAMAYLIERKSPFLKQLTVPRTDRVYRRFWQAGPGQDRNVYDAETAHRIVTYIHNNPLRRGLVGKAEDWLWSSAGDWAGVAGRYIQVDRSLPAVVEFAS